MKFQVVVKKEKEEKKALLWGQITLFFINLPSKNLT